MDVLNQPSRTLPFHLPTAAVRTLMWRLDDDEAYSGVVSALRSGSAELAVTRLLSSGSFNVSPHQALARLAFDSALFDVALPDGSIAELQRQPGHEDRPLRGAVPLDVWHGAFALLTSVIATIESWRAASALPGDDQAAAEHRLVELPDKDDSERAAGGWAAAEAGASLAFAAARALDASARRAPESEVALASRGGVAAAGRLKVLEAAEEEAVELVDLGRRPPHERDHERWFALQADRVVQFLLADALAAVLTPASRVWLATRGYQVAGDVASLRPAPEGGRPLAAGSHAVACVDSRVARRLLADAMTEPIFLALYRSWIREMREIAVRRPGTGACTIATAMQLWLWTLAYLSQHEATDEGQSESLFAPGTLALADTLSSLLAARSFVLDLVELSGRSPAMPLPGRDAGGALPALTDLCHAEAARAAGEVGRVAAELVCGGIPHPAWDADACERCYHADDLEALEDLVPGLAGSGAAGSDVIAADGSRPSKAGPCVRFSGVDAFMRLRAKLDGCLAGSRLARQRDARQVGSR